MNLSKIFRVPVVAIIGGGPAGVAAAKACLDASLEPVIFEQSGDLGGQWNSTAAHSGVWASMRTNTSHLLTCFSDVPHREGTAMFPTNQEIHAYLKRYAELFGVTGRVRFQTRVESVSPAGGNRWRIRSTDAEGAARTEDFDRVVIATGRYNRPSTPKFAGIERFAGIGGASHAFGYSGAESHRGQRVLVVGNSISGLEICSDLAMHGAARVISSCRNPRYVLTKIIGGRPTDCAMFTRFAAWAGRALPIEQSLEGLRQEILRTCGNPAQFGALAPEESLLKAKVTQCQHFLPLVAEGRIAPKREPVGFTETAVEFADGSTEQIDAVIFATGYDLNLPFLAPEVRARLNADAAGMDLYKQTFHPSYPTLAFAGMFSQVGPYFPVIELQARWISLVWSGARALPARRIMDADVQSYAAFRKMQPDVMCHEMALQFAEAAGVEPDITARPGLARALLFGPLAPIQFRIEGPGALPGAAERFIAEAASFGCVDSAEFSEAQRRGLAMLASSGDGLAWLAEWVSEKETAGATLAGAAAGAAS